MAKMTKKEGGGEAKARAKGKRERAESRAEKDTSFSIRERILRREIIKI